MIKTKDPIGLDGDGVIIDHTENKIKAAKLLGISLAVSDTPADILGNKLDSLSYKEVKKMIYDDPRFLFNAPTMLGAEDALRLFQDIGQDYYLISRQKNPGIARENLEVRGLWNNYFDHSNTFFVENSAAKNQKVQELGIKCYLDDQPSVLMELDIPQRYLFDPLDRYPREQWYKKVESWSEFIKSIG